MNIAEKLLAIDANTDRVEALNLELEKTLGGSGSSAGSGGGDSIPLQEKTINIVENGTSEVIPDVGYALSKATVNVNVPIPSGYIKPIGQKEVSENGTYDVAEFEKVNVNVPAPEGDTFAEYLKLTGGRYLCYQVADSASDKISIVKKILPMIPNGVLTDCTHMFDSTVGDYAIPLLDTSKVTSMNGMFYECTQLSSVPLFDTDNVTNMAYMFYYCTNLTSVPLFNTSKVTSMIEMFRNCTSLVSVPLFDTKNVANMNSIFRECKKLKNIPSFDTNKVTSMQSMFNGCASLTEIPLLDTRNVTNASNMFYNCGSLSSVPKLDFRSVTIMNSAFTDIRSITEIWVKNIKTNLTVGYGTSYGHLLTVDSLVHLCYELRDTGSSKTLTMGATNLEKLADVYVKTIAITDEMRAEDDLIDEKLPFVRCESTDEGAMLITDYVTLKHWALK